MIRQCEEYLFCELEKKENLCEECLETMQEPMQGVLPIQILPKDAGMMCFWNRKGKTQLWEKMAGQGEKKFVTETEKLLALLQKIKREEKLSLDGVVLEPSSIFCDEGENLYLPVLPVAVKEEVWEQNLVNLLKEMMIISGIENSEFGKSMEVLLQGKMVTPENLNRNIQILVKKQEETEQRKTVHSGSTEELDWQSRMQKSAREDFERPLEESAQSVNGVFLRRKTEIKDEPQERVVSGRLKQKETQNERKDTQVLRKNMLSTGEGTATGFSSVAPVQLNQKKTEDGHVETTPIEYEKQLHFVSFGMNQKVDLLVNKSYFVIGKWEACADGIINYTGTISRSHCAIQKTDDGVYIEDLGSANGTFVNEQRLEKYKRVKITTKDTIRLAQERFAIVYK